MVSDIRQKKKKKNLISSYPSDPFLGAYSKLIMAVSDFYVYL